MAGSAPLASGFVSASHEPTWLRLELRSDRNPVFSKHLDVWTVAKCQIREGRGADDLDHTYPSTP